MKKLLIATTALVATAGMASADITISGHAAAGVYSGLSNKDGKGAITANASTANTDKQTALAALEDSARATMQAAYNTYRADATVANAAAYATAKTAYEAAAAADAAQDLVVAGRAASVGTYSGDGIYSNAGVDFTMTGATDNGISFSAAVNIDAGTEIDSGDFELDGKDGGTAGLGSVSMTGSFGTCLLYTSPSPRDRQKSRMPSSA